MFQVAKTVSETLAEIIDVTSKGQQKGDNSFSATFILGGQIKGGEQRLYLIYPEGNFIEVSEENRRDKIWASNIGERVLS